MTICLPRRSRARCDRAPRAAARDGRRRDLADRAPTRRPGGERRGLGRRPRRQLATSSASAAPTTPGRSRQRGCASSASSSLGPVEPTGNGVIVSLVDPSGERTMCPDRGVAAELRPEEIDAAWFADCDSPPRLRLRAAARARPLRRRPARSSCARGHGAADQHRPLVVERDSRLRRASGSALARGARTRRRLRERGRGRDRRRADRRRRPGSSSAAPREPRSTATSVPPLRRSTRRCVDLDRGGRSPSRAGCARRRAATLGVLEAAARSRSQSAGSMPASDCPSRCPASRHRRRSSRLAWRCAT